MGRRRARMYRHALDSRARRPATEEPVHPRWRGRARALRHRLGDGRVGRAGRRSHQDRPDDLLVGDPAELARRAARRRAAACRCGADLPRARRDPLDEPAARIRLGRVSESAYVVVAGHARPDRRRHSGPGRNRVTSLRAALLSTIIDTPEPGAGELCHALEQGLLDAGAGAGPAEVTRLKSRVDRKSTRLNSSHGYISYAVFCLKKKKNTIHDKNDEKLER